MLPSTARGAVRPFLFVLLGMLLAGHAAAAQPLRPPPPPEYKVTIRYRIRAGVSERVAQFLAMTRYLESIGFKKDEGPENEAEDPSQTRMTGTIRSDRARQILNERHVESILLVPAGYELPSEAESLVKVQLELTGGLPLARERMLADQARGFLQQVGFHDGIGYDHRGHTRIVGTIPAGSLNLLLEDLRLHASGWLTPQVPVDELPLPIRNAWPVRVVEVTPEPAGIQPARPVAAAPPAPQGQEYLLKITPELRALAKQEAKVRMEVILAAEPAPLDLSWRRSLEVAAGDIMVEGRMGPVITVRASPGLAAALASLRRVSTVRLARAAIVQPVPASFPPAGPADAIHASGLDRLHAEGKRGRGVRLAVIDTDFRGYEQFLGSRLPATTRYLDLTAECEVDLTPHAFPPADQPVGHGTQCALAAALAAPEAELSLIRIDADAPFQLLEVARYLSGDDALTTSLEIRNTELSAETRRLERKSEELLKERRAVLEEFGDEETARARRAAYYAKQAELEKEEKGLQERAQRFLKLVRALKDLRGISVVACALVWDEGHMADGGSSLGRFLDVTTARCLLWFQSAGNTNGQVWSGVFRDEDGNGVMEFAPLGSALKRERWTPELNFLGWQPGAAAAVQDLPKTRLRISVQWREPHDPEPAAEGDDPYRTPLANLRLLVLRQRDPSGTRLASDDLEVVATSVDLPQRLDNQPNMASYEQTVEFSVDAPGRYALRIEGVVPRSTRPAAYPILPSMQVAWELRPRVFVHVIDDASRKSGRAIFWDYTTQLGNPGMPADAQAVLTVGAADLAGHPEPYTAAGPALSQDLHAKPDLFAYDTLPLALPEAKTSAGTGLATSFAAGAAVSAMSAGAIPASIFHDLHARPGEVLRVPSPRGAAAGK